MRRFLEQLFDGLPSNGRLEFIADFAKPYPSLVIAEVMGAPLEDANTLAMTPELIAELYPDGPKALPPELA